MNNAALIRALITYAVCVPLAVFVGYQLTDPLTYSTFFWVGLLVFIMIYPILMRWHHLMLIISWNVIAVVFFIPGNPYLWMVMVMVSLGVSILQKTMNRRTQFINVPQITWSLVCLFLVILATAKMTGGIGLRTMGSDVYGGKKYIVLLCSILGYFALTLHAIPPKRVRLCIAAFFLGGLTGLIGDAFYRIAPGMNFIFWMFPPNYDVAVKEYFDLGTTRLNGAVPLSAAIYFYMLARYGLRGIFTMSKPWRAALLALSVAIGLLGGFRGTVIVYAMIFILLFFLEGLHRTKLVLPMVFFGLMAGMTIIAVAPKLPYTYQRSLSFLPIPVDPEAKRDAQGTAEWRVEIWRAVMPQIPKHLLLGTGYAISAVEWTNLRVHSQAGFTEDWASTIVGDYHNGPLSVILPFGIWGVIAFVWFLVAGMRAMYLNHMYGAPELRIVNTFLFASFITKTFMFLLIFGALNSDMQQFVGLLGFSISLNGGVCRPSQATVPEANRSEGIANLLSRRRPVFQR